MDIKEPLMSVNKYERPTVLEKEDAVYMVLMRLLILHPGSIQSRPKMGVGVTTIWRYNYMENIHNLEEEIEKQIRTYLPQLVLTRVKVRPSNKNENEIFIEISINNVVYNFETNNTELKLINLI